MDKLPNALLLQILTNLNDSADVACCRVASKAFNSAFPDLRSINLRFPLNWKINLNSPVSDSSAFRDLKPFQTVLLDLISKHKVVESLCIKDERSFDRDPEIDDVDFVDADFAMVWLPRVSRTLKLLSISGYAYWNRPISNVLRVISEHCYNLVNLNISDALLSLDDLNPMPMLTRLTLAFLRLEDKDIDKLNKCFPNLEVLKLIHVDGLEDPVIHHLNLKTFYCSVCEIPYSMTLITPNLITLEVKSVFPLDLHVEAPMLSHFDLSLNLVEFEHTSALSVKKFENLKTFRLKSSTIGVILSEFPITKSVENLELCSTNDVSCDPEDLKLTLRKVFMVFPNVSSLVIGSGTWSILESCLNKEDWDMLDGKKGLKTLYLHLKLADPSLTLSGVASILNQCVGVSEVSLRLHYDIDATVSASFLSKCMIRWPGLKWSWRLWQEK